MYKLDSPLGSLIGLNPCFIRVYNIKSAFHCFSPHYRYIIKQLKKPSKAVYHSANYIVLKPSGHPCRKHSPAARVFYIILVFSNARRVLSQCTFFFCTHVNCACTNVPTSFKTTQLCKTNCSSAVKRKPLTCGLRKQSRRLLRMIFIN